MEAQRERRLFVQYPVVFLGSQGVGEGRLFNLSTGGGAIESRTAVQRGTVLTLRVHLPSLPQPIAVDQAEVTWTAGEGFGVQFLSLGTRDEARLSQLIVGLQQDTQGTEAA
ncbi:MAG: PilZ domain-containing protein [Nitrospirae bacterium]|nr:PilZ domain-containing protein [Nitrospirota bacterium]